MNIFPIQGLTEDRCAYGRTQGVLLPVWNTKECPVSVFHINADDMILSMLMIWFFSKNHIMKAKESVWQKISDLNKPLCHQPCPFSQAGSVTPVLPLQGSMQTRSWVSLRPMRSYICTFDIINFNKNHCGGQSKSNIRGSLPFQISGKWDFVPPSFLCVCGGGALF